MKKVLLLIITMLSAVNVYADNMFKAVSAVTEILPLYGEFGSLNEIGYNEEENEVVAVFKCSDEYLASLSEFRKAELCAYLTGILLSKSADLNPFNVAMIIKTPGNTTGKTFYIPADDISLLIDMTHEALSTDNQATLDRLIEGFQETPMQCDPTGSFCYTIDFDKQANEIVGNIQFLIEIDANVLASTMGNIAEAYSKEIASTFKMFETLMKTHKIGFRLNMFQGAANEPFYSVRFSPEQIFGE